MGVMGGGGLMGSVSPQTFREVAAETYLKCASAMKIALEKKSPVVAKINGKKIYIPYNLDVIDQLRDYSLLLSNLDSAQTILFSSEQANVFLSLRKTYFENLDFRLPFPKVLLVFGNPLRFDYDLRFENDIDRGGLIALALSQEVFSKDVWDKETERNRKIDASFEAWSPKFPDDNSEIIINSMSLIYKDDGVESYHWQEGNYAASMKGEEASTEHPRTKAILVWKSLAVACIGYINCENVCLEKTGEVSEGVNRKRESKGKSRLEPYHICKVVGVSSNPIHTGNGTKHAIRYDVRGHFRKLGVGKTIWVRPHQRGIENELYVPKVYAVDYGTKQLTP